MYSKNYFSSVTQSYLLICLLYFACLWMTGKKNPEYQWHTTTVEPPCELMLRCSFSCNLYIIINFSKWVPHIPNVSSPPFITRGACAWQTSRLQGFAFFLLMLKSHIWTITYLLTDQTNEHVIANAAPAEEKGFSVYISSATLKSVPCETVWL